MYFSDVWVVFLRTFLLHLLCAASLFAVRDGEGSPSLEGEEGDSTSRVFLSSLQPSLENLPEEIIEKIAFYVLGPCQGKGLRGTPVFRPQNYRDFLQLKEACTIIKNILETISCAALREIDLSESDEEEISCARTYYVESSQPLEIIIKVGSSHISWRVRQGSLFYTWPTFVDTMKAHPEIAEKVTSLDVCMGAQLCKGVGNSDLKLFPNLRYLSLASSSIEEITGLNNLETLSLEKHSLKNKGWFVFIHSLPNLRRLQIDETSLGYMIDALPVLKEFVVLSDGEEPVMVGEGLPDFIAKNTQDGFFWPMRSNTPAQRP